MVVLTMIVMTRMFLERVRQIRAERIRWKEIPSSSQMATRLADTRAADNFRSLFEVPVLLYLALVVAFVTNQVTATTLALAWVFVVSRYVHSAIHCTYNRVRHRFAIYFSGCLVLWLLWGMLAIGLLQ